MHFSMISEKKLLTLSLLALPALVAVAYGGALRNGFVWDDETFIVNNKFVHDLSRWPEYFRNPEALSDEAVMSRVYRPVQTLSYAVDARLWAGWAGGFHLTSLLLHLASCFAMVFAFGSLVGRGPALAAACVFAIHPALSEGVLSLASRGNQLYALFGLLALGLFLKVKEALGKEHLLSVLALALALLSKEPAIALVALLPLLQAPFERPWKLLSTRSLLLHAPYLAVVALYLVVRSSVVGSPSVAPYWGGSLGATLLMQSKVMAHYLGLLIWPFILKGRYSIAAPASFPDPWVIAAVLLNGAMVVLGAWSYRCGARGRFVALAVAWFYVSLAPVSNLVPLPGSMMGERFLYFTFAGMVPLLAGAAQLGEGKLARHAVAALGSALLVAFLATDVARTRVWESNGTFFALLSKQEPEDYSIQLRMAQVELEAGDVASALQRLERLVRVTLSSPFPGQEMKPHYWYGRALLEAGRLGEADRELSTVVRMSPQSFKDVALLLAETAARSGDIFRARTILEGELRTSPNNGDLWNGLGNLQLMMRDFSGAISSYRRALEINPRNQQAATNLQQALRAGQ
jgi:tetratricopeptide (TPR) repeat protein